jgi:hypothetical protein
MCIRECTVKTFTVIIHKCRLSIYTIINLDSVIYIASKITLSTLTLN